MLERIMSNLIYLIGCILALLFISMFLGLIGMTLLMAFSMALEAFTGFDLMLTIRGFFGG